MADPIRHYNAGVQRAKGTLEIAAALYDSSLSEQIRQPEWDVVEIDSRVSHHVDLKLGDRMASAQRTVDLAFATGGFYSNVEKLAKKEVSVVWLSASIPLTMAYRGTGPFKEALPVRALACFPSYDAVGFAVRASTGITSLGDIASRRFPLRLSARDLSLAPFLEQKTMFSIEAACQAAGFSLLDLTGWGGEVHPVFRPSDEQRWEQVGSGAVDAIFDEGITSWGQMAVNAGFRFLPLEGEVLERLEAIGFRRMELPATLFDGLEEPIQSVNIGGWPLAVHADMPDDVAYAICEAIELRHDLIPTDNDKPLDMAQLCRGTDDEAPLDVPLHPGAERFYRERGYL